MIPSCDQTGTPLHFHSSTTSGSACFTKVRRRLSISPRQSPSSLILASISCEGVLPDCEPVFFGGIRVGTYALRRDSSSVTSAGATLRSTTSWSTTHLTTSLRDG